MTSTHHASAPPVRRSPLAGRIAGAAVAGALLLGAPLLGTLAAAPGVAVAAPIPCAEPYNTQDCDHDGVYNSEEIKRGTDMRRQDTDGDGRSDLDEIFGHTDPLNAQDRNKPLQSDWHFDFGGF